MMNEEKVMAPISPSFQVTQQEVDLVLEWRKRAKTMIEEVAAEAAIRKVDDALTGIEGYCSQLRSLLNLTPGNANRRST